eukprot:3144472-Rhodomonas_salina.2
MTRHAVLFWLRHHARTEHSDKLLGTSPGNAQTLTLFGVPDPLHPGRALPSCSPSTDALTLARAHSQALELGTGRLPWHNGPRFQGLDPSWGEVEGAVCGSERARPEAGGVTDLRLRELICEGWAHLPGARPSAIQVRGTRCATGRLLLLKGSQSEAALQVKRAETRLSQWASGQPEPDSGG